MTRRTGECKRCGKCCKLTNVFPAEAYRHLAPAVRKVVDGHQCQHLRRKHGQFGCAIYSERPDFCRDHPGTPEDIIPGCGYSFDVGDSGAPKKGTR
jgi:Fe-S-cluster containining protein